MLFVGDVVGRPGRDVVEALLPGLREELDVDVCIVNGENVADGVGITPRLAERLLAAGADALTLGNHTWRREEIGPYLSTAAERSCVPRTSGECARPRPRPSSRHATARRSRSSTCSARSSSTPRAACGRSSTSSWSEARATTPVVVVDVHAEATSEKVALAAWLDGRVTAVLGTHTHVQTSDARVLPGGTAALTDVGMTGPHDSVIGVEAELAIRRMRTGMPVRFETAHGGVRLEGALVDVRSGDRSRDGDRAGARPLAGHMSTASRTSRRPRTRTSQDASGSNCMTSPQ